MVWSGHEERGREVTTKPRVRMVFLKNMMMTYLKEVGKYSMREALCGRTNKELTL